MNLSPRKRWTKAEKWLLLTPLLVGGLGLIASWGQLAVRKKLELPIVLFVSPNHSLTSISLSGDGSILVAGEQAVDRTKKRVNSIYVWQTSTLKPLPTLTRPISRMSVRGDYETLSAVVSPNGKRIAYGTRENYFGVVDRQSQLFLWKRTNFVHNFQFSPDGKWLAFSDNGYYVLDAESGLRVASWQPNTVLDRHVLNFSPDGKYIITNAGSPKWEQWKNNPNAVGGEVEVRWVKDWKVVRTYALPNARHAAISSDTTNGGTIIVANTIYENTAEMIPIGARLCCFNFSTGQLRWELDTPNKKMGFDFTSISDICCSPNGDLVAVMPPEGAKVWLLDTKTGAVKRILRAPPNQAPNSHLPYALAFSPDGNRLYGRGKSAVLIWDLD